MKLFGHCSVVSLWPLKGKKTVSGPDRTAVTVFSLVYMYFFLD